MNTLETSLDYPRPDKSKSYKQLKKHGHHSGILMKKEKILNLFPIWNKRYAVVHGSCMYLFKSENDLTYEKAFTLFGYRQVARAFEIKEKAGTYPFKLVFCLDEVDRYKYFSTTTENERNIWMKALKREMEKVHQLNSFDNTSLTSDDSGIFDTETPISTSDYFARFKGATNNEDDDSDLESEYTYIKDQNIKPNKFPENKEHNQHSMNKPFKDKKPPPVPPYPLPPLSNDDNNVYITEEVKNDLKVQSSSRTPSNQVLPLNTQISRKSQNKQTQSEPIRPEGQKSPLPAPKPPKGFIKSLENIQAAKRNCSQLPTNEKMRSPPAVPAKPDFEKQARWNGDPAEGTMHLVKYGTEGTYMIRKGNNDFDVLMVIAGYQARKYKIFKCEGKVSLDGVETFDSMNNLILHYKKNFIPKRETKLTKAFKDVFVSSAEYAAE